MVATLDAAARLAGGALEVKHNYNGWRPDLDSPVLAVARAAYERLFGEPPVVTAVHAGLETAVIGTKVSGGLDMLAFGPQIERPIPPTSASASRPWSGSGGCWSRSSTSCRAGEVARALPSSGSASSPASCS